MDENYKNSLVAHKTELITLIGKSEDYFEKQLSYISSGALGLSFILVEKVITDVGASKGKFLLMAGWLALTGSLIVNLLSHRIAAQIHSKTITEIEHTLLENEDKNSKYEGHRANNRRRKIGRYNSSAIWLLFSGIMLILIYTAINLLYPEAKKDEKVVIFRGKNFIFMSDSNNSLGSGNQNSDTISKGLQGSPAPILPQNTNDGTRGLQGSPPPQTPPVKKP